MQRPLTLCNGGADAWHQSGLFAEVLLPEAVVLKQRFPASAPVQRPQLDGHDRLRHAVCMRLLLSPNLQGIHAIPTQRGVHGCSLSRAMTMPRPLTKMPGLQGISALMCAAGRGDVTRGLTWTSQTEWAPPQCTLPPAAGACRWCSICCPGERR